MSSASPALSAAIQRPLPIRRRRDVQAQPLDIRGRRWWRLKDPVSLRFWQLGEEEYFLWEALEPDVSVSQLEARFRRRFAPRQIDPRRIQDFLAALHREGLVYSNGENQGEVLARRGRELRTRDSWSSWTNPLAIRFRGVNPSDFFAWLAPRCAWMFSTWTWLVVSVLWGSSLLLLALNADRLSAQSTHWMDLLTPSHLVWLAITMAGVKVAHELGHALTCHHFGGRCHELGVMLLVFTPCLYCNVSDAWLIPSRFRRMAISAAGICVELTLAAVATWIWWWSQTGAWSTGSMGVMFVCSVNTLLLNGNPLLRYDGYFLLSDFLEVPNLRAAGDAWVRQQLQWCTGVEVDSMRATATPESHWFVPIYGMLSLVYRWCLTGVISWVAYVWLAERGFAFLGATMLLIAITAAVVRVGGRVWQSWSRPRHVRRRWGRVAMSLVVALGVVTILALVPWPESVSSPAVLEPADAEPQYVAVAGVLQEAVERGDEVRKGDVLVRLRNEELEWELQRLQADRDLTQRQLELLRRQQVQESSSGVGGSAAERLPALKEQLADIDGRIAKKTAEAARLIVQATRDGQVFAPRAKPPEERPGELRAWLGSPLASENVGCYLESGTQVCQVGTRSSRIRVVVDQAAIERIREGQTVTAWFTESAGVTWHGRVRRVEEIRLDAIPTELLVRQLLPMGGSPGGPQPTGTYFQVSVELEILPDSELLRHNPPWGATGVARIETAPTTLVTRGMRWLAGIWAARP